MTIIGGKTITVTLTLAECEALIHDSGCSYKAKVKIRTAMQKRIKDATK
jgi:hypothetical protein